MFNSNGTGYSLSDIAAVTEGNNNNGGWGNNGDWWIILLFLFAFGGFGRGGFGNGGYGGSGGGGSRNYDGEGRMYYNGGGSSSYANSGGGNFGGNGSKGGGSRGYSDGWSVYPIEMRDYREGRSPMTRKNYMEGKEMHHDKAKQMQELDKYVQELTDDVLEMIHDASPEEKMALSQKMTSLANKIK